jgi:predicted nucleic acid-binding protein
MPFTPLSTSTTNYAIQRAYDDIHGDAAEAVLEEVDRFTIHETAHPETETTRIDAGEASCVKLADTESAAFLITDDLRALPELQTLTDAQVAISPILLRALVT